MFVKQGSDSSLAASLLLSYRLHPEATSRDPLTIIYPCSRFIGSSYQLVLPTENYDGSLHPADRIAHLLPLQIPIGLGHRDVITRRGAMLAAYLAARADTIQTCSLFVVWFFGVIFPTMVIRCCVVGCNSATRNHRGEKIENGLSFHRFSAWRRSHG